jgi:hypothetical protein
MSSIDPKDDFNPKDPLAPGVVHSETNVRSSPPSSRSNFNEMLQEALRQFRRHPLEYERERSRGFHVVAGFVAGIAVSAIIAFVFLVLIPKFSPSTVPQPAASEVTSTIAPPGGDKTTPEESEALLKKFMEWQQKK